MAEPVYDQLALALREFSSRFGETAFTDRRRLTSLLSDRMPDARREIRVVSSAIDERVFETLARTRPEQIGMEMDRLAARLENAAGIRTDIALSTVHACAYGLGLAPLPSAQGPTRGGPPPPPPPPPMPAQEGSWVGVSQPITAPQQPTYRPPQTAHAPPPPPTPVHVPPPFTPPHFQQTLAPPTTGWTMPKILVGGGIGLAAVLVGLYLLGSAVPDNVPNPPAHTVTPPVTPPITPPVTPPVTPPSNQPTRTTPPQQPVRQPQPPSGTPTPIPAAPARANGYGDEFLNFGVQAQETVQNNVGTPTPTSIPGARFVSTTELSDEMRKGTTFLLIDALEDAHPQTIIRAVSIPYAGRAGNIYDDNEESLKETLNRLTQGRTEYPLVFFCQGVRCWESYNAALRAVAAGYRNVLWYRGGIYAWSQAGLPMQPTQ